MLEIALHLRLYFSEKNFNIRFENTDQISTNFLNFIF